MNAYSPPPARATNSDAVPAMRGKFARTLLQYVGTLKSGSREIAMRQATALLAAEEEPTARKVENAYVAVFHEWLGSDEAE